MSDHRPDQHRPAGQNGVQAQHGTHGSAPVGPRQFGFDTRAVHAGQRPDPYTGARAMPIYQTTSFVFESPDHAANLFELQEYGNIYSRIMNPTVAAFEERVASLEGGAGAVAASSGQAAQFMSLMTMLVPGDHIVAARTLYGGTFTQFEHTFRKMSVDVTFVDPDDPSNFKKALTPRTKLLYGETIGNPSANVFDIEAIAEIAHGHDVPLVIDNTFASPYLCRPIEWGADVVLHSGTKFIGGHGTSIAGVIVESGRFNWSNGKFDTIALPSPAYHGLAFHETFGPYGYLMKVRCETLRDVGACLSPFNAFLLLLGLETLPLRMEKHCQNALAVAQMLDAHEAVSWVRYPGLTDNPYHTLSKKYVPNGAGAVFTFGIAGGRAAGKAFIEKLELVSHLANVGDAKTLVIHPASTTHQQMSDADLTAAGIGPEMIRISVGLESIEDILWDLDQALRAAQDVAKQAQAAGAAR
ncbi:MAG: O-acetylhomoserine aminocarboxypropyltransferase/cysteine synthase [Chloroflexi bacterium]|nr:O-acetylhomoserine aminocarboxypropyltransferase/cysteine synthase [Chloroflexota bacterium]